MSSNSDHTKPQLDITSLLPEVYQSEVNQSVFETAFNRHLTKDDTHQVSGLIGQPNPQALINRQLTETTPHRQAYQLAPTMYNQVGTVETAFSFKAMQQQMNLVGIDMDRFPLWGNALKFNWVPPVNIDMLVNYRDYYWSPPRASDEAQYMTIENRCNKSKSQVAAYKRTLSEYGATFVVQSINYVANAFVIDTKLDVLFVTDFIFLTRSSTSPTINNKYWTVSSSTYDIQTNTTHVVVSELISTVSATAPTSPSTGDWWYNPTTTTLYMWSGATWQIISANQSAIISIAELLSIYQVETNCFCNQSIGWDVGAWDDNQIGNVVWNTQLLIDISVPAPPPTPVLYDLWYNTTLDTLNQWNGAVWVTTISNFSVVLLKTTGTTPWDYSTDTSCAVQKPTQWTTQNNWIHKSEVQSFIGVKQAQLPILEYNSNMELNEWVQDVYSWKYRSDPSGLFVTAATPPHRFELEPIKGYKAVNVSGQWQIYLFDKTATVNRDIDHTATFVPGYQFKVVDNAVLSSVYTAQYSEYRETTSTDPVEVQSSYMVTVVYLTELSFTSPTSGSGINEVRIEPLLTSVGDIWRGYHAHWLLDTSALTSIPASPQSWDIFRLRNSTITSSPVDIPGYGILYLGSNHQELTVTAAGVTDINLSSALQYNGALSTNVYSIPNSGDVRVYVNGVRQYDSYEELTSVGYPNFTVVGFSTYTNMSIPYVTGVRFSAALDMFDVVRIEVGPASFVDMGTTSVPVRTIEDETQFALAVAAGTQPVYDTLSRHRHIEQVKTTANQYPLFNVYDVVTGEILKASPVFSFSEDSSYPINVLVHRRLVASVDGKEYQFDQHLLDTDDRLLYGYRNTSTLPSSNTSTPQRWWYNPATNILKGWDGKAWTTNIVLYSIQGNVLVRRPTIASTPPQGNPLLDMSLWYDWKANKLYIWTSSAWVLYNTMISVGSDPTLQSIWACGLNHEQFVPQYVDSSRTPTTVGSPAGDWQLPDQWTYNPDHRNRRTLRLSELYTHFTTILSNQPKRPGLQGGGWFTLTQDRFNYGLGGTIKEYNDSFDTLLSSFIVSDTNPVGIMKFARSEYDSSLQKIRELFTTNVTSTLSYFTPADIVDPLVRLTDSVMTSFSQDQFMAQVYVDTSAYNPDTDVGVDKWIATPAMFGIAPKYAPRINNDDRVTEVQHHDGHRSRITVTNAEIDQMARVVIAIPDSRSNLGTLGKTSVSAAPATTSAYSVQFMTSDPVAGILPGTYWYHTNGVKPTLYRLEAYAVTNVAPSLYLSGVELPNGTMYYNISHGAVYVKAGLAWTLATALYAEDITPLWKPVDFELLLAGVILNVETQLYNVTPDYVPQSFEHQLAGVIVQSYTPTNVIAGVYWYNPTTHSLTVWTGSLWQPVILADVTTPLVLAAPAALQTEEQHTYGSYMVDRFMEYVTDHNITAPLVNTTYNLTDPFTWNYASSYVIAPPIIGATRPSASTWQETYVRWYGTPYPHLEPWVLQHYTSKPTWWDTQYADTTGTRMWTNTMWTHILAGTTPHETPPTPAPVYQFTSVNIGGTPTIDGYAPDALLPPYYAAGVGSISSLYTTYEQIVSPAADYAIGDVGPTEWEWKTSSHYVYDKLIAAFRMQPIRFMHYAFGPQYTGVAGLQVETTFNHVYTHRDTLFHGDLYNTNQVYKCRGLNQWYTNFNRYTGFDSNAKFKREWTKWLPRLTYQVGGILDTETFAIMNQRFAITNQDYNLLLVNNGVIADVWVDTFNVSILSTPPSLVQYNNQGGWKLELSTASDTSHPITCYGVRSYSCVPTTLDSTFHTLRYPILSASSQFQQFVIAGDYARRFNAGSSFHVVSPANNGTFTVRTSSYQSATNTTRVVTEEPVFQAVAGGDIDQATVVIPWVTGSRVAVASTKLLPAPLVANTAYYVIKTSVNSYKLAETEQDALANIHIDITSLGDGALTMTEVDSTFVAFGGSGQSKEQWYHYALDTSDVYNITPPYAFMSMQALVNIVDGHAAYQRDKGVLVGSGDSLDMDPDTGQIINWQLETERFIDWAYGLRNSRITVSDRFGVSVTASTSDVTFTDAIPQWPSGSRVVLSTTGQLPSPLLPNTPYYYRPTATPGVFQLSITNNVADISSIITYTTVGSGTIYAGLHSSTTIYPSFEINPMRNNIQVDTPLGVLSNVINGPYADIRATQTVFDQYGRPLHSDNLTVYREDKRSRLLIRPNVPNDVDIISHNDPYNYIHFGGAHLFIEGYEHFVILNDSTVSGSMVYEPFLGLMSTRFDVDYYKKKDFSLRPTLGGYYLHDGKFKRNIEGVATDLRDVYDTYTSSETAPSTYHARALVGYSGTTSYMDLVNVKPKAQYLFYKAMIQSKGSVNSVAAYINSRRFVDAQVDECWAWKIAEYGDARPHVYPEIKLFAADGLIDDIRLEFLASSELATDPDVLADIANGFQPVSFKDTTRWNEFPELKATLETPLFLDAEITSSTAIIIRSTSPLITGSTPEQITGSGIQYWCDGTNTWEWNGTDFNTQVFGKIAVTGTAVYIKHDTMCDDVRVYRRTFNEPSGADITDYTTTVFIEGTGVDQYARINAEISQVSIESFRDILVIYTINPAKQKISPAKLIDTQADVVIQTMPLWHPALGHHYYLASHNVDLFQPLDPARYQLSLSDSSDNAWNIQEAGTVWLDTNSLDYLPYYDDSIYPDVNDRLYNWGTIAPWADIKLYKWIQTTTHPENWDASVISDATNSAIPQNNKATGTPRATVFRRDRTPIVGVTVTPVGGLITTGNSFITSLVPVVAGSLVLFTTTGTLPTGIVSSVKYRVDQVGVNGVNTFQLRDIDTLLIVDLLDVGVGALSVVPAFTSDAWTRQPLLREKLYAAIDIIPFGTSELTLSDVSWNDGDVVSLYKNGLLIESSIMVDVTGGNATLATPTLTVSDKDIIDVVRAVHDVTTAESEFNPDYDDDGTVHVQWKRDYEYTTTVVTTGNLATGLINTTYYYYWVENSTDFDTTDPSSLSLYETGYQLRNIPSPYFVVQKPKDDPTMVERFGYGLMQYDTTFSAGTTAEQFFVVPVLYRQAILRNAASYITDDNRYIIRFVRDLSLRDNVKIRGKSTNLKNKHEEWAIIRQHQPDAIPVDLWNKLIESLVGYTLADPTVRVPSLERELYDTMNNTDTRYGLDEGQAFVDKTLALASVIAYLLDPNLDFYPIDLDNFFSRNSFDTISNVEKSMLEIYNTFPTTHVNAIWFSVLQDALSTKAKYRGLMKTSWVTLHGIRILEVGGKFDD